LFGNCVQTEFELSTTRYHNWERGHFLWVVTFQPYNFRLSAKIGGIGSVYKHMVFNILPVSINSYSVIKLYSRAWSIHKNDLPVYIYRNLVPSK